MPTQRVHLDNSAHRIPPTAEAVRRTNPNQWIDVTIGVRRRQDLPDLSALDETLPGQRTYMTHDELAQGYGSDPASVERIKAFAAAHGLVVARDEPMSARMTLGGTMRKMSDAFGVTVFDFTDPKLGAFHARTGRVSLPQEVAGDITGVFGFSNQQHLRRGRHRSAGLSPSTAMATRRRAWFYPQELAPLYDFPTNDASGQCIALLEFGGGVETDDVAAYFKALKLPEPVVQVIAIDGVDTDPQADPDSTGEVMLDIDVAGAMAPGAKLAVYFSTFDEKGLIDALSAVIADTVNKPSVVSISWGWDENQKFQTDILWSPAAIDHVNHSFLAAAHLGITVCVSTGDDGSEAQMRDGRAHVNFPATSPYVLAVGGTTLHSHASTLVETVWNDGPGSGTGGGVSDYTARPAWQAGITPPSINPGAFAGRAIPDVAANADPNTGYRVMSGGAMQTVGGTSASAPLWASLIARTNKALGAKVGNFNALLYGRIGPAGVLRDIVDGNNDTDGLLDGQYKAGPGWDACTGWGSPDGRKLLAALGGAAAPAAAAAVTPPPSPA
ncbi:S53 family peptidase [Caulobacter sp. KR2-114]|uniref:S53 family peptidase n=1 Tax=Caulobacter sp. KR2-114 TaxID=3400912 RepID=UPI003C0576C4